MCSSSFAVAAIALTLAAFTVCIFVLLRVVGFMVGGLFRGFGSLFRVRDGRPAGVRVGPRVPRICDAVHCRQVNPPHARYCSQCGREL